ncbi:hypothetical protein EB118_13125 [bacterium]|nr:hypothetical protein [bacterium]
MGTRNWDSSWLTKHSAQRVIAYNFNSAMANNQTKGGPSLANGCQFPLTNPQTGINTASLITNINEGVVAQNWRNNGITIQETCCGQPTQQSLNPFNTQIVNQSLQ